MRKLVSQREYSRLKGLALSTVQYAIKVGRIKTVMDADGKPKIDVEQADEDFLRNTDPSKSNRGPNRLNQEGAPTPSPEAPPQSEERPMEKPRTTFSDAKTATQILNAKLLQVELDVKTGKLVDAEAVRNAAFKAGRQARDRLMNIPNRIHQMMAAESDPQKCYEIIEKELLLALEGLSSGTRE